MGGGAADGGVAGSGVAGGGATCGGATGGSAADGGAMGGDTTDVEACLRPSPALTDAPTMAVSQHESSGHGARFFTAREASRLMGFPESFIIPGHPNRDHGQQALEDYQRYYHQIGNAVCPPVVCAIAQPLLLALGISAETSPDHALAKGLSAQ